MTTLQLTSLLFMDIIYLAAGITHFSNPKLFLKITPKWVPSPKKVNFIVGFIEIALGIALLFDSTRSYAAIGIIALLIAVFPANINHFLQARRKDKYVIATLIRLPIQIILIYWAYTFI